MPEVTLRPEVGYDNVGQVSVDGYTYHHSHVIAGYETSWDAVHDDTDATSANSDAGAASAITGRSNATDGGSYHDANCYIFYRAHQTIDTKTLDDGGTPSISAAKFSASSSGGYDACAETGHTENDRGYTAIVAQAALGDVNKITVGDYNSFGATPVEWSDHLDNGGPAGVGESNDFELNFNETGIAGIAVNGTTGFGLAEGHDIQDDPFVHPGGSGSEYTGWGNRNVDMSGTQYDPELIVTYTVVTSDIDKVSGIALANIEDVSGITAANGEAINGIDF